MSLFIVSPPQFEGRPEKFSFDKIVEGFPEAIPVFLPPHRSLPSEKVYDTRIMVKHYAEMTDYLIGRVERGDKVLWVDGYNPSLQSLIHFSDIEGLDIKNYIIFRSGALVPGDYLYGNKNAIAFEGFLVEACEKVFVATNYLKNLINGDKKKICVTGLPIPDVKFCSDKKNVIIFPHRWADDKRKDNFVNFARWCQHSLKYKYLRFEIFTQDPNLESRLVGLPANMRVVFNRTREEYFERLQYVKYVWADSVLETFGYAILEAYLSGAIPILNNMGCYAELYPRSCYETFDEMVDLLDMSYEDVVCNVDMDPIKNMRIELCA